MAVAARTVTILFVAIGIFSLVALTIYVSAMTYNAVDATGGSVASVPSMFNLSNMDCALRSSSCDILHAP
jgi:hypothetical protein